MFRMAIILCGAALGFLTVVQFLSVPPAAGPGDKPTAPAEAAVPTPDDASAEVRRGFGPPHVLEEPKWGFRVAFPGRPTDKTNGSPALGVWEYTTNDTVFDVQVDVRDWERQQDLKADRAFVDDRVFSNLTHTHLRQENGKRQFRLADTYEAAEAVYGVLGQGGGKTLIRWWVVKAPYRLFELHARGNGAVVRSAIAGRFFDSFTVLPVTPARQR